MVMSTQTLDEAARLMEQHIFIDSLQIMDVAEPVTVGAEVTRLLTPVGKPVAGLVQSVTLESAVDGRVVQAFSVKVPRGTTLREGQAIKVLSTRADLDLIGMAILLDTVSKNGLATLRKGTGQTYAVINQEGKEAIS